MQITEAHMTHSQMYQKVESGGGPIFNVVQECLKRSSEPFLIYIYMAYNVISCRKVAENTQILKIAKFAM